MSSPTISHDDEDQQSDGALVTTSESEKDMEQSDKEGSESDASSEEDLREEEQEPVQETIEPQAEVEVELPVVVVKPARVIYGQRDILELGCNVMSNQLVQYTVLPENNVNCFFQNRAQYWRLSSAERQEYSLEKCPCCDFTYPSTHPNLDHGPKASAKNANEITDSIMTFLKSTEEYQAAIIQPPVHQNKRMMNTSAQFGYQMPPSSQPPQAQQYPLQNNGFFNNTNNSSNNFNANYNQQPMNPFMNNTNNNSGYGTTLALLNLMNTASRNAASAFQAMNTSNTTPRYYNNNTTMNNSISSGYGLYKQF